MSWTDLDGVERGGGCSSCGAPVQEEHHALCPTCFRAEQGWTPPPRPAPGAPPLSFIEGLATVREQLRTIAGELLALGDRVDRLERERRRAA